MVQAKFSQPIHPIQTWVFTRTTDWGSTNEHKDYHEHNKYFLSDKVLTYNITSTSTITTKEVCNKWYRVCILLVSV